MTISLALLLPTTGCGDVDRDEDQTEPECEECAGWGLDEPSSGPTTPCEPEPLAYDWELPEIPDEVLDDQCPLEGEVVEYQDDDQPDRTTTWNRQGEILEKTVLEDGERAETVDFEFGDDADRPRFVEKRTWIDPPSAPAPDLEVLRWEFDDQFRLVEHVSKRMSGEETTRYESVEQTWNGGRLVSRTETEGVDETRQRRFEWEYDASDRLSAATYRKDGRVVTETDWNWDEGRPRRVQRHVDGALYRTQQWSYHPDGSLAGRRIEVLDSPEIDGEIPIGLDSHGLDSTVPGMPVTASDNELPAPNAHLRADASDGCYELPTTAGHGYPRKSPAYSPGLDPGSTVAFELPGEGPDSTPLSDLTYDYLTPVFPAPYMHYGHLGLSTTTPGRIPDSNREIELEYDASGRMIEEQTTWETDDGRSASALRERDFQDGEFVADRVTVEHDGETRTAELRFEHTADRRVRRRFRAGEEVARQIWTLDDRGRPVGLEIHARSETSNGIGRSLLALFDDPRGSFGPSETTRTASYGRTFDEQGRPVRHTREVHHDVGAGPNLGSTIEYATTFGDHGPTERTRTRIPADGDPETTHRTGWSYDDGGHLAEEWFDDGADGSIDRRAQYTRDDEGRLLERVDEGYHRFGHSSTTYRDWRCHD